MVQIKRVYEAPKADDGIRVLVDRLWPRGLSKAKAQIDVWLKELAPSTELRKWFGHDPEKWTEFVQKVSTPMALRCHFSDLFSWINPCALKSDLTMRGRSPLATSSPAASLSSNSRGVSQKYSTKSALL